jgi:hypothetical protein
VTATVADTEATEVGAAELEVERDTAGAGAGAGATRTADTEATVAETTAEAAAAAATTAEATIAEAMTAAAAAVAATTAATAEATAAEHTEAAAATTAEATTEGDLARAIAIAEDIKKQGVQRECFSCDVVSRSRSREAEAGGGILITHAEARHSERLCPPNHALCLLEDLLADARVVGVLQQHGLACVDGVDVPAVRHAREE